MVAPLEAIQDLLRVPRLCTLCGASLPRASGEYPDIPVCSVCLASPDHPTPPLCRVCGRSLISEIGICTLCRDRRYPFANHRSLYEYRGAAKKLIGLYKFSHHRSLSRFFADRLAEILPSFDGGVTIVPVPGNPSSVRHRGWDQVGLIAGHLARDYGAPVEDILRRRRSKTQKSLGFVSRSQNIAGKIHLRPSRERLDVPRDIILLDDVFTTGSTAAECTRVLLRARAERVRVLTLAID